MAYTAVNLPLTGAGDATAAPAVDLIGGLAWQGVKLFDATEGSTVPIIAKATTPDAADPGMVVRFVPTTADAGAVTVKNPSTSVDAAATLTSAGSTRLVGRVTVENPTTSVSLSSQHTVTVGNPTTAVQANLTSEGSTRLVGQVTVANPTTAVEANLTSLGSTKLVGQVTVANPTTAVSLSSQHTVTVGNPTTQVNVTSGVVLGAGSTGNTIGAVAQGAPAPSSDNAWWVRTVTTGSAGAGSTTVDANLTSVGSTREIGTVRPGPGSSDNYWSVQPLRWSSALTSRTTANTSVQTGISAASTAILAVIVQNMTTVDVGIGFSTAAPTTALANVDLVMSGRNVAGGGSYLVFGMGYLPLFIGNMRAVTIGSTVVAGGVVVTRFLSS